MALGGGIFAGHKCFHEGGKPCFPIFFSMAKFFLPSGHSPMPHPTKYATSWLCADFEFNVFYRQQLPILVRTAGHVLMSVKTTGAIVCRDSLGETVKQVQDVTHVTQICTYCTHFCTAPISTVYDGIWVRYHASASFHSGFVSFFCDRLITGIRLML